MHQATSRYTVISTLLFIVSASLAAIAFIAFVFASLTYLNDQGSILSFAVDLAPIIKGIAIGIVCFFISYVSLLGAIIVEHV